MGYEHCNFLEKEAQIKSEINTCSLAELMLNIISSHSRLKFGWQIIFLFPTFQSLATYFLILNIYGAIDKLCKRMKSKTFYLKKIFIFIYLRGRITQREEETKVSPIHHPIFQSANDLNGWDWPI